MKYGKIDGLDKQVSRIGQGCIMLKEDKADEGFALLDAAFEAGVNLFDSSHVYGGGQCDRVFGRWVREHGIRDQVVLMDKCCHPSREGNRVTPEHLTEDLETCLDRLGFENIDIFAFHRDDEDVPVGPLVECLNEHIWAGRIKAVGASNWTYKRIAEANRYAEEHGLQGFSISSPHYSLAQCIDDPWGGTSVTITGQAKARARAWYEQTQMALLPWSALAGGLFSGRFRRDNLNQFTEGADERTVRCYASEYNFRRLDRAKQLADQTGATLAQIALAWCICGPLNCFPLMAAYDAEQAHENAAAADIELTESERGWLHLDSDTR